MDEPLEATPAATAFRDVFDREEFGLRIFYEPTSENCGRAYWQNRTWNASSGCRPSIAEDTLARTAMVVGDRSFDAPISPAVWSREGYRLGCSA